jgi:TRAP-type uncharacterized transport system fused permease subunit
MNMTSVVRGLLYLIGIFLVSRGLANQTQVDQLFDAVNNALPALSAAVGVLLPIISLVWDMYSQTRTAHLIAVKNMHAVDKILVKPSVAARDPDNPAVILAKDTTEPKVTFAPTVPPPGAH